MKERKIYWRRKSKKIIAEGKRNKKTIFLFTLPTPEKVSKSSLFTKEKQVKIAEKISRLDYKSLEGIKEPKKVRTINIASSLSKDENLDNSIDIDEELNELIKRVS